MSGGPAPGTIAFELDGLAVAARPGETLWQVARRLGQTIPHLCHRPEPGYRPDGNCRLCVVEITGERVLAPSCLRRPTPGMKVRTNSDRVVSARRMVLELLLADQPERDRAHDPDSLLWRWADRLGVTGSRFPARPERPAPDRSHPAMAVQLDSCIHCGLCVRACREVQVNDVIGMAHRGAHAQRRLRPRRPDGRRALASAVASASRPVPPGPFCRPRGSMTGDGSPRPWRRPFPASARIAVSAARSTYHVHDNTILYVTGRDGPANHNRLCVKGRFGFDYVHHPHRLTVPLIRRPDAPRGPDVVVDPAHPETHFRPASWDEALDHAAAGLRAIRDAPRLEGPGGVRLGEMLE